MSRFIANLLAFTCMAGSAFAGAVETVQWERLPLPVELLIDQERVLFTDRNVRVGVPGNVGARLRVQTAAGAVYLRANAPIEPSRLQLQDIETGEVILLDIRASTGASDQLPPEPMRIVRDTPQPDTRSKTTKVPNATPTPVILIRYAAQNLYAPLRTIEPLNGVRRQPLTSDLALDQLLPNRPVQIRPLAAWRLDDYRVSALLLVNTQGSTLELDPRELQGQFFAASFQHSTLGPAGSSSDTTVLYLVTHRQDLISALTPAVSRFDTALNVPEATNEE